MNDVDLELAASVAAALAAEPSLRHTQSLVVAIDGTVVFERHFHGDPHELRDLFSITKGVVGTLAGIAVDDGALGLDTRVADVLADEAAGELTIRHLLTMATGRCRDGAWDIDEVMLRTDSWTAHLLRAPVEREPGRVFSCDNGAAHILAAVLQRALGEPLAAFAHRRLFRPLGIERYEWPSDPDSVNFGFGHLRLALADLVRFGCLYAGTAPDIVSPGFRADATPPQTSGGWPENLPYGFLWWCNPLASVVSALAAGWAGQFLLVAPARRMVAAGTGDPRRLARQW